MQESIKPAFSQDISGTSKLVPFPKPIYETIGPYALPRMTE
jgi:hypothetical protein